ncbi:ABC transporter substrate-binding protein [Anaerocolumna sp.]|uniref:ABC transporter substrate-binding protein n=1 Tax=Anaerocolumna sp. TaxID=2041569 RepID=UPI0028A583D2|nr:ABC transporter substrate-binding protein [Anaerocolumna sp.]
MKIFSKNIAMAVLCTILLFTAAGCSNKNNSGDKSSGDTPQITDVPEDTLQEPAGTRIVNTVMGDIEVPADPQRVVVNWYLGDVFALELNVAGYFGWEQEAMPFYDKLTSTAKIENWEPEDVMKVDPDLIITYSEDDFSKFNKIAPVLVIPEGDITILERVKIIGEATGHTAQAEAVVQNFETKLAEAKEKLQNDAYKDKTFSINEDWGSGSYGVYYETGSRGGNLIYDYLGLKKPDKLEKLIKETGEGRGGLSYEVAAEYFGDYMIWFRPYDSVEDVPSEYETTQIWETIPAVQEGKVVTVPGKMSGMFYYSDILCLTAQLDYILDGLIGLTQN